MAITRSLDLEASSSQYATIADGSCPNLEITGSKTVEAWVKPESVGAWQYIASKFHNTDQEGYRLGITDTGLPRFQCKGLTTNEAVNAAGAVVVGWWVHIAGVYNSATNTLKIYVNGAESASVTASGSSTDSDTAFEIGSNSGDAHGETFDGCIRNLRVWSGARTAAQILNSMNEDTPADVTNMQGNWKLENSYADSSGNGYTVTPSGSPVFVNKVPFTDLPMIEPTATLYDNHNDNSVDGALWTVTNLGDATTTEVTTTDMKVHAPGTGAADADYTMVTQDVKGGNGMKCIADFNQGTNFNFGRVGIADTVASTAKEWTGTYIGVQAGTNGGTSPNTATLYSSGYTVLVDNSGITLAEGTDYTFKIFEDGFGKIRVYIDSMLFAVLQGNFINNPFIKYDAGSAADPGNRFFTWLVNESYDYASNPISENIVVPQSSVSIGRSYKVYGY